MPTWVYSGLAQPDRVHFTSPGYRRLAAVLFGDLMREMESYEKTQ